MEVGSCEQMELANFVLVLAWLIMAVISRVRSVRKMFRVRV